MRRSQANDVSAEQVAEVPAQPELESRVVIEDDAAAEQRHTECDAIVQADGEVAVARVALGKSAVARRQCLVRITHFKFCFGSFLSSEP